MSVERSVRRIKNMEKILDDAVSKLEALDRTETDPGDKEIILESLSEDIKILEAYYTSRRWKNDLSYDDRGMLPKDLKRGVLSEDGIYNVLLRFKELYNT